MTAFLVVLAISAAFFLGRTSNRRPALATPAAPASLESHISTLREVLVAADELTPETEAWLAALQRAVPAPVEHLLLTRTHPDFVADYNACTTTFERGSVVERWHRLGYRFDAEMRAWCLAKGATPEWRNALRAMFDEQDAQNTKNKKPPVAS